MSAKNDIVKMLEKEREDRANMPKYVKVGVPLEIPLQMPEKKTEKAHGQFGEYDKTTYIYVNVKDMTVDKTGKYEVPEWLNDQILDKFKEKSYPEKIVFVRRK